MLRLWGGWALLCARSKPLSFVTEDGRCGLLGTVRSSLADISPWCLLLSTILGPDPVVPRMVVLSLDRWYSFSVMGLTGATPSTP